MRRQVNCVRELDGVLLPESACPPERPLEEQVCLLQEVCHNSLPQTRHQAQHNALRTEAERGGKVVKEMPPPAAAAATVPEVDINSLWRIGDWGLVCFIPSCF